MPCAETHGHERVPSNGFASGTYEPIPRLVNKIKRTRWWLTHQHIRAMA